MLNLKIFRLITYENMPYKLLLCLFFVSFFCSCTTISDSRQRAQEVFLYHNQLVSQLILISSDDTLADAELFELEQAETLMVKACRPLNEVAAKVRDGDKTSLRQRINIPKTLNECERQTKAVEQLLTRF